MIHFYFDICVGILRQSRGKLHAKITENLTKRWQGKVTGLMPSLSILFIRSLFALIKLPTRELPIVQKNNVFATVHS